MKWTNVQIYYLNPLEKRSHISLLAYNFSLLHNILICFRFFFKILWTKNHPKEGLSDSMADGCSLCSSDADADHVLETESSSLNPCQSLVS